MNLKSHLIRIALVATGLLTVSSAFKSEVQTTKVTNRNQVWEMTSHVFKSKRTTTHYWDAGPANGPLIFFIHGWPEIGLTWRAQMQELAAEGWHCIAPDLRGFGGSSVPVKKESYALKEIVDDIIELHSHLGGKPAVWVGHDWGSPVVGLLVAHYPKISRAAVLVSVPYMPNAWALPSLLPYIDRKLYPAEKYPDGQWDYWRFYLTHFDQSVSDMNADIPSTLASIFTKGVPSSSRKVSPSAVVTAHGGRFGAAHRAPATKPDPDLWPEADFDTLTAAFKKTGFRPANSYYLNDVANIAYARTSLNHGKLSLPVLYINDEYEPFSNINVSEIGAPMRKACSDLTVIDMPSGHWVTLELKAQLSRKISSWLKSKGLK